MDALAATMARYYFDVRDDDMFVPDEVGIECDGVEAARKEASAALADMAKDAIPGADRRVLAVEVRNDAKRPVLEARLVFEIAQIT